jgi:hypothetical protein
MEEPSGIKQYQEHKIRTCTASGSEADMNFDMNE